MAFLDDMKRSLTMTGKQVAEKTKELSETVRLKTQIGAEKEAVRREYQRVGKKVFETASAAEKERYSEEFEKIRGSLEKIQELESALSEIDGSVACPECGAKVEKSASFCSFCGARIEKVKNASGEVCGVSVIEEPVKRREDEDAEEECCGAEDSFAEENPVEEISAEEEAAK